MKRAAITGATGMIGSALARLLTKEGVRVLAFVNPASSRLHGGVLDGVDGIDVVSAVGADYAALAADSDVMSLPRCDIFYHFAWSGTLGAGRSDEKRQQGNVQMALDAVRLAHALGCERFVFAGSQAEYGRLEGAFSASTPCHPLTPYGAAKLAAERQTRALCHELGMVHVAARIGSVYGPGDNDGTVIMQAIRQTRLGQPFSCTKGEQLWDHIYCDDAAEAFALMGKSGKPDAVYPVGTGKVEPLRDHIQMACEAARPGFAPDFGALPYPDGQVMYLRADIDELAHDTGFAPVTAFSDGIRQTVRWYEETHDPALGETTEKRGGQDARA